MGQITLGNIIYKRTNDKISIKGQGTWALQVHDANFMLSKYNGAGEDNIDLLYYGANGLPPSGKIEIVVDGEHCHENNIDVVPNDTDNFIVPYFYLESITSSNENKNCDGINNFHFTEDEEQAKITVGLENGDINEIEFQYDSTYLNGEETERTDKTISYVFTKTQDIFSYAEAFFQYKGEVVTIVFDTKVLPSKTILKIIPENAVMCYPTSSCSLNVISLYENTNVDYEIAINVDASSVFTVENDTLLYTSTTQINSSTFLNALTVTQKDYQDNKITANITYVYNAPKLDSMQIYLDMSADGIIENDMIELTSQEWVNHEENKYPTIIFSDDEEVMEKVYSANSTTGEILVDFTKTIGFKVVYQGMGLCEASLNNKAKSIFDIYSDIEKSLYKLQLNSTSVTEGSKFYIKSLEEDWHCDLKAAKDKLDAFNYNFEIKTLDEGEKYYSITSTKQRKGSENNSYMDFVVQEYATVSKGSEEELIKFDIYQLHYKDKFYTLTQEENITNNTPLGTCEFYIVFGDIDMTKLESYCDDESYSPYLLVVNEAKLSLLNGEGKFNFQFKFDQNVSNKQVPIDVLHDPSNNDDFWLVTPRTLNFYKDGNAKGLTVQAYRINNEGEMSNYIVTKSTDVTSQTSDDINKLSIKIPQDNGEVNTVPLSSYSGNPTAFTTGFTICTTSENTGQTYSVDLELADPITKATAPNKDKITVFQMNYNADQDDAEIDSVPITSINNATLMFNGYLNALATNLETDLYITIRVNSNTDYRFRYEYYKSSRYWSELTKETNTVTDVNLKVEIKTLSSFDWYDLENTDVSTFSMPWKGGQTSRQCAARMTLSFKDNDKKPQTIKSENITFMQYR